MRRTWNFEWVDPGMSLSRFLGQDNPWVWPFKWHTVIQVTVYINRTMLIQSDITIYPGKPLSCINSQMFLRIIKKHRLFGHLGFLFLKFRKPPKLKLRSFIFFFRIRRISFSVHNSLLKTYQKFESSKQNV